MSLPLTSPCFLSRPSEHTNHRVVFESSLLEERKISSSQSVEGSSTAAGVEDLRSRAGKAQKVLPAKRFRKRHRFRHAPRSQSRASNHRGQKFETVNINCCWSFPPIQACYRTALTAAQGFASTAPASSSPAAAQVLSASEPGPDLVALRQHLDVGGCSSAGRGLARRRTFASVVAEGRPFLRARSKGACRLTRTVVFRIPRAQPRPRVSNRSRRLPCLPTFFPRWRWASTSPSRSLLEGCGVPSVLHGHIVRAHATWHQLAPLTGVPRRH